MIWVCLYYRFSFITRNFNSGSRNGIKSPHTAALPAHIITVASRKLALDADVLKLARIAKGASLATLDELARLRVRMRGRRNRRGGSGRHTRVALPLPSALPGALARPKTRALEAGHRGHFAEVEKMIPHGRPQFLIHNADLRGHGKANLVSHQMGDLGTERPLVAHNDRQGAQERLSLKDCTQVGVHASLVTDLEAPGSVSLQYPSVRPEPY